MKIFARLIAVVILCGLIGTFVFPDKSAQIGSSIKQVWNDSNFTSNTHDPEIQYERGLYFASFETPANDVIALKWYLRAADQGYMKAQQRVGIFYLNGKGTSPDIAKALSYFEKAAAQGDKQSLGILIDGYRFGAAGIPKNEDKALFWSRRAKQL